MAFSLPQQIKFFRPMVDAAWRAHCDRECITDSTAASKDRWYREQLRKCLGVDTTKLCNKGKHFDTAMAWFEELADAGVHWQVNLLQGDAKRARHLLDETIQNLRLTEEYVTSIAQQMGVYSLKNYTAEQLLNFRIALLTHVRRQQKRALHPQQKEMLAAPE